MTHTYNQRRRYVQSIRDPSSSDTRVKITTSHTDWRKRSYRGITNSFKENKRVSCDFGFSEQIMSIIMTELNEVKEQFAVPRRTEIVEWSGDMEEKTSLSAKIWS